MTSKSPFTLRSEFNAFVMPVMGSTTLKKVKLEKVTGKSCRKKLPEKVTGKSYLKKIFR